jgi:hypothetical protein
VPTIVIIFLLIVIRPNDLLTAATVVGVVLSIWIVFFTYYFVARRYAALWGQRTKWYFATDFRRLVLTTTHASYNYDCVYLQGVVRERRGLFLRYSSNSGLLLPAAAFADTIQMKEFYSKLRQAVLSGRAQSEVNRSGICSS